MAKRDPQSRIPAPDSKYTGEENRSQEWGESNNWGADKFESELSRMFRFYGYYSDADKLKASDLIPWMRKSGYSDEQIRLIEKAPRYMPCFTASKMARMLNLGLPDEHPGMKAYYASLSGADRLLKNYQTNSEYVHEELRKSFKELRETGFESDFEQPVVEDAQTVSNRALQKVNDRIVAELDYMLDEWILSGTCENTIRLHSLLVDQKISPNHCKVVTDWIELQLKDLRGALDKESDELVQGYKSLSKAEIRKRIQILEDMISDVDKFIGIKKASRKKRTPKVKSADKQVERLKFLANSAEYKIPSVTPQRIPGSFKVFTFNVKYKTLSIYEAATAKGLAVKGTSLIDYNESTSLSLRLRKPEKTLTEILSYSSKQIDKLLEDLKTKKTPAKGRINSDTLILRVIDVKM